MPITIFRGLPGSGKSKRLIELVNEARSLDRPTVTIVSADASWIMGYKPYALGGKLASREPGGVSCPIDHFVSTTELEDVLAQIQPGTLIAVEEAQMFGSGATRLWVAASERGADLILVSPSPEQVTGLSETEYSEEYFSMLCELCHSMDAVTAVVQPDNDQIMSLCVQCFNAESDKAKARTVRLLLEELPHPGQHALYQPVELPECSDWRVSRPDSQARADIVAGILREFHLLDGGMEQHQTYLDIGCSTGFFCNSFQQAGMYAKGVDAVENNIMIAKLLDSFVRRAQRPNKKFVTYVVADAYEYLQDTPGERFDVISAFSVIQWVMTQRSLKEAIECFDRMFEKTQKVCIVEMGYSTQDNYAELLPITVDREWVYDLMLEHGGFADVRVIDATESGIMRDLFIGVKPAIATAARREG